MPRFTPIGKNVLVRLNARAEQSAGGIAIPMQAQKAEQWGTIVGVGAEVTEVTEGEEAFIAPHMGTLYIEGGVDFIIIPESKIHATRTA